MLYGVKLNWEGVTYSKEGLSVFTFYMVNKFDKIFKSLSLKDRGRRGMGDIITQNLLKNSEVNC